MQADLKQALTEFRKTEEGTVVLIIDPYHPDGFEAGEFLFGSIAGELFDQECERAKETGEMDRLLVIAGEPFGEIMQSHAGPSADTLAWVETLDKWAMSKRRSLSYLGFIQRPEIRSRVDQLVARSQERDRFNEKFKIKRGKS